MSQPAKGQRPKRSHHFVPQFYLKGFSSAGDPERTWVYRLPPARSGSARVAVAEPQLVRIEKVCVEYARYAVTTPEGSVDFEIVENRLAESEGLANPVLKQVRVRQQLSPDERRRLAAYMSQMHRRVQKNDARRREIARKATRTVDWSRISQDYGYRGKFKDALDILRNPQEHEHRMVEKIRILGTVPSLEHVEELLCRMSWRFLCTSGDQFFVTSDNPAIFDEHFGLGHFQSVVVFPIASDIALWASWDSGEDGRFVQATDSQVYLVNHMIMKCAHREVYASRSESWILDELDMLAAEEARLAGMRGTSRP